MHAIEFTVGFLLVLLVLADVFGSVLVPRPSHSRVRIGPAVASALAPLWRRSSRLFPKARLRQDVRGSLAPAILVAALAAWVAGLSFGFALMLHSQPQNVSLERFGFGEALFQSALAISTLGMIHADIQGWARAVVAVAGISGFSVLTLVVAFLLSIQAALHQRESLVLTLTARAGRPPNAATLLLAHGGACDDELATLFATWERWTADVLQSHLSYPVLLRFRSLDENSEWLACLGTMLDAAAVLVAAEPPEHPRARRAAGFLLGTGARAVREIGRVLAVPDERSSVERGAVTALEQALSRTGLAPVTPAAFAERLDAVRAGHAGRMMPLAARLDLVWHDTLTGGGARPGLP